VGAGFFFVGKKDGSLRPCIDYRGLNSITLKNKYPLPLISSAFAPLHGAAFFSKLDLRNAYHLVRIREGDQWKTAFNTPLGHFEYLVMPFGLSNAPAVFQALVNDVLRDMLNRFIFVYLNDILIFSPDPLTHQQHVRQVLQRLLENKLYVKAEKCEFHVYTVSFLGYVIAQGELRMDPAKIAAVSEWPVPTNRKELQRFLGFANFYRLFIRSYSRLAAPLTALTSTATTFHWSSEAESAFGGGCLRLRGWSCAVSAFPLRPETPPLCLLLPETLSSGEDLRCRQLRTPGSKIGFGGVPSLAGGRSAPLHRVDGPQELGVPPDSQITKFPAGQMGLVFWSFRFCTHIPSSFKEHKT